MADVASKRQTTALFISTIVTRTRRHTEVEGKGGITDLLGNLCCAREHSVVFRAVFYTVKLHSLTYRVYGALNTVFIQYVVSRLCS
jgi:hypothetical protein